MLLRSALPLLIGAMTLSGCLTSCDDDDSTLDSAKQLQHSWTWQRSSGGFAGGTHTPTSTGQQQKIEFDANGTFRAYTNGQLTRTDTYTLQTGTSIRTSQPTTLIVYGNGMRQSFDVSGKQLTLSDEVYDGFQSSYER